MTDLNLQLRRAIEDTAAREGNEKKIYGGQAVLDHLHDAAAAVAADVPHPNLLGTVHGIPVVLDEALGPDGWLILVDGDIAHWNSLNIEAGDEA